MKAKIKNFIVGPDGSIEVVFQTEKKITGTGRKALLKHLADNLQGFNTTVGPLCLEWLPNEYVLWLGFDEDDVRFIDAVAIIDILNQLFESFKKN
ncbi:hypothetical protein [Methanobrevibacter sp.]|uniref:hypothetical protein n=1 Tax=Methanobrevibacter sp. TaxID=66852 RepID=UPI0038686B43